MQDRHAAFHKHFPQAEELGTGAMCNTKGCTKPFLLVTGLTPDQVQSKQETWSNCLQEVVLDVDMSGATQTCLDPHTLRACVMSEGCSCWWCCYCHANDVQYWTQCTERKCHACMASLLQCSLLHVESAWVLLK